MSVFEENNDKLVVRSSEKLFLDTKTTDVNFAFLSDGRPTGVVIPAHRIILSVGSPVFEEMFYGSSTENGETYIDDASVKGFREFLQIFYLGKVRLTFENIVEVINLCKKYKVPDGLKLCENALQKSTTTENICSRLSLAIDLDLKSVSKFCEEEIKRKAKEILKSTDFVQCNRNIFEKVLELVPSSCDAKAIVDACLVWAKAKCEQKKLQPTTANLKCELGGLIGIIPFERMNTEQFAKLIVLKKGLLNDDLEGIVLKTMTEKDKIVSEKEKIIAENEKLVEEVKKLKSRLEQMSPKEEGEIDDDDWW